MKLPNAVWTPAIVLLVSGIAVPAVWGGLRYPGSAEVYTLFNFAFLILFALIFPRPRLYVYTFLALLLFLGFWMKTVVQAIWTPGFIEPVGGFDATPLSWDNALIVAAWGALGAAIPRLAHLLISRRRPPAVSIRTRNIPSWFMRFRRLVWPTTVLLVIGVNLANSHYAFFQVGVNPRLILPAHLNVVLAWLVNTGFALWLATLVFWEFQISERSLLRNLQLPLLEAFASSITALSRQLLLLHMIPYVFALVENRIWFRASMQRRALALGGVVFAVVVLLSVSSVFLLRILQYDELSRLAMNDESLGKNYQQTLIEHVPYLLVHRWVGLEGVLSVNSAADRGRDSFMSALTQDPKRGADSLFQQVAKTRYLSKDPEKYTYLSNAGVTAILAFSGSLIVVFFGMVLTVTILLLTEHYAQVLTVNPFFVAVAGAGAANAVSQATFPYLTAVYMLQLWVAIVFINVIQRIGPPATITSSTP